MGCYVFGINCHVFLTIVCSISIYCSWKRYWQCVKTTWDSYERCKDVEAYIRKNPAISFSYLLFVIFSIVFGFFFPWFFSSFIKTLYTAVEQQIKNIDVNSYGFRSISLSIAGSITLLITILGVLLTLIRNLLTRQQNRTDEERLVTEQISRAVEQMGAYKQGAGEKSYEPNIEVRLGGLYSLQRIMKDSIKDELAIAKIFYAYVRENAKRDKEKNLIIRSKVGKETYQLPDDIQATLSIIRQFDKNILPDSQLNFSRAIFNEYHLIGMNFSYFILKYADFTGSDFTDGNLSGADLSGATLINTRLVRANLSGANLSNTYLMETRLSGVNLSGADLSGADLRRKILPDLNLSGANLSGADLEGINLEGANLSNTNLTNTILENANLENANLSGANLENDDLFSDALSGANLSGADLSSVKNLRQKQIEQAHGDEFTKLPEGLIYPAHWIQLVEDEDE